MQSHNKEDENDNDDDDDDMSFKTDLLESTDPFLMTVYALTLYKSTSPVFFFKNTLSFFVCVRLQNPLSLFW